jgi:hypothetical protein
MMRLLESFEDILRGQDAFEKKLKEAAERRDFQWGHQGGSGWAKPGYWLAKQDFWVAFRRPPEDNKYWNAFGMGLPDPAKSNSPVCEVNFPLQGIRPGMVGALAKDESGKLYVLHSGKIGGGKKGVGRALFEAKWKGGWRAAGDGLNSYSFVLVGLLDDPNFLDRLGDFLRIVNVIRGTSGARCP